MLLLAPPLKGDEASSMYSKGRDTEIRQDYEAAYTFYTRAYQLNPKNLDYQIAATRVRVIAGLQHVHRGQQLVEQGKLQEGLLEFRTGADIDPASFIAQQEIRRTEIMITAATAKAGSGAVQQHEPSAAEDARSPVALVPLTDAPISLNLTEDSKVVYTTLGKLAGINVVFDPEYKAQRITVNLNGVSLTEALELLWMQTRTFWRPVTPNTIFVAADTPGKRKEIEQSVVRTFYLSNLSEAAEIQDAVATLRTELDVSKITPLLGQQAIFIRGTPDQLALAEKLIGDMDKARPEVIVEVAIMQVSRERIRTLGLQPPTSTTISLVGTGATATTGTTTGTSSGQFTLNDLSNLNATNFAVTVPSVTLSALLSDSKGRILQNPQIRTLDGQKASLKIGERVPIATGSFTGIGGGTVGGLVNTQFTYLDVGVNVDITPHVHADGDISLKVMLDVSSVDSMTDIGGISQPVIGQHKIEQEIRLKEGEVNVIGGMLQDTDQKSMSGLPLLSSIPFFRYLFSSQHVDKREDEIVFVLVPRIIRRQDLNIANLRPLDVGTANNIDLRRSAPATLKRAALSREPREAVSQAAAPSAVQSSAAPAQSVLINFSPPELSETAGDTFVVDVLINGATNLFSAPLAIQYDQSKLQLLDASLGSFLTQDGRTVTLGRRDDPAGGMTWLSADRPAGSAGMSGSGSLFHLKFVAKAEGRATISVARSGLKDANKQEISASGVQAVVDVKAKAA